MTFTTNFNAFLEGLTRDRWPTVGRADRPSEDFSTVGRDDRLAVVEWGKGDRYYASGHLNQK
jgi:hypothetical protein